MNSFYRLEFYVPLDHLETVKQAIFTAGAGKIGNYDCCSWETAGTGQFRPLAGSHPFIGQQNQIEQVTEYKVETVCNRELITQVIKALKEAHPYETPAIQYWLVEG